MWPASDSQRSRVFANLKRAKSTSEVHECRDGLMRMGGIGRTSRDWNSVISAYGRVGGWSHALDLLQDMGRAGVRPDVISYNATMATLNRAQRYQGALKLFDEMEAAGVTPNNITYNTAITACEKDGQWQRALSLLEEMRRRGVAADVITYNAALSALEKGGQTRRALALFDEMGPLGIQPDRISHNAAILACKADGSWERALKMVESMEARGPPPDDRSYNAAIAVCGSAGRWQEAVRLLDTMRVRPSDYSFNIAIKACSEARKPEVASSLLARMRKAGVPPDVVSCSTIIAAWAREGQPEKALSLLDEMRRDGPRLDAVSYNAAMSALEKSERGTDALRMLRQMEAERVRPNEVSYCTAISACAKAHLLEDALSLLGEMRRVGLHPSTYAYSSAITACERAKDPDKALGLLKEMQVQGVSPDALCYNAAISACAKGSNHAAAMRLLSEMESRGGPATPTEVSFNAAIASCGPTDWEVALRLLARMKERGVAPKSRSYAAAIGACGRAQQSKHALRLLSEMEAAALPLDIIPFNSAISACERSGEWEEALKLLERVEGTEELEPSVVTYNAAMAACEKQRQWQRALELLPRLTSRGLAPDLITFVTLISACARVGESEAALRLLRQMKDEYGLQPSVPCYTSAIAACEQPCKPDVAMDLLKEVEASGQSLDSSLYAATMQVLVAAGRLSLGFDLLARLHAKAEMMADNATYVVHWTLLSGCTAAGDAGGAARVQGFMDHYQLESIQAVAHAVVDGANVRFVDGTEDTPTYVREELRALWRRVHAETEYEPCFEAIPHAVRERFEHSWAVSSLQHHAEKKALVELLLRRSDTLTLRVNLRMCADCHAFFKGAAKLIRRRITVHELDSRGRRVHAFDEGGGCSCAAHTRAIGASTAGMNGNVCVVIDEPSEGGDANGGTSCTNTLTPGTLKPGSLKRPRDDGSSGEGGGSAEGIGGHACSWSEPSDGPSQCEPTVPTSPSGANGVSEASSQVLPLRQQVRREIERFAIAEGELAAILSAQGLTYDDATAKWMVESAVAQISQSVKGRGASSYALSRGASEAELRRVHSVRRYLKKLVRAANTSEGSVHLRNDLQQEVGREGHEHTD